MAGTGNMPDRPNPLIYGSSHVDFGHADNNHAASARNWPRENTPIPRPPQDGADVFFDMYFDYPRYQGDKSDVTTLSEDLFSEGSPSALTAPSSVGTGQDVDVDEDNDVPMSDPPAAPEPDSELHWPRVSGSDPPRDADLDIPPHHEAHGGPIIVHQRPGYHHLTSQPRAPGPTASRTPHRSRKVDTKKTSQVRQKGACLRCRIDRVSCDADGVCEKCENLCSKAEGVAPETICARRTPHEDIAAVARRWCWNDTRLFDLSSAQLPRIQIPISISFVEDPRSPLIPLEITVNYSVTGGFERWEAIPGADSGRDEKIFSWARQQLLNDADQSFESHISRCLMKHAEKDGFRFAEEKEGTASLIHSQRDCIRKLSKMTCMWRVWRYKRFYFSRGQPGLRLQPLPEAIGDYLHQYAGEAISELEKSVLRDIDKLLAPNNISAKNRRCSWSALNIAMWVSLWQLMLIYRGSLKDMQSIDGAISASRRNDFRKMTGRLYNKVAALYSGFFRTRKVLDNLNNAGNKVDVLDLELRHAFQDAWDARQRFYLEFDRSSLRISPGDKIVQGLIIGNEEKVFSRKRPNGK